MSGPIEVTLPIRTESEANNRDGWRKKHTRTSAHRWAACVSLSPRVLAVGIVRQGRVRRELACSVVVYITRVAPSRGLDCDNLRSAGKGTRDGVADALGVDDRDPRVRWEYAQRRGPWGVEIRVERVAAKERAS